MAKQVMKLVNEQGAIQSLEFTFNEQKYKVIGTRLNRSIWDCVDIHYRDWKQIGRAHV